MMDGVVEVISVSKTYRAGGLEVRALENVSLNVEAGEFVAVSGPSGAGKTTLLNIIAGLDAPTEGEVIVLRMRLRGLSEDELAAFRCVNIGYVFQSYNLISTLTARENIEFAMELAGLHDQKCHRRTLELLDLVGLTERADHLPTQLSGGEQQRVAFARALANDPPIVLADEPTGNLDEKTALDIVRVLRSLKDGGKTVIVATHHPKITEFADKGVLIEEGEIVRILGEP